MKKNVLLLFVATSLLFACSSDDDSPDTDSNPENAIIGAWDATELQVDNDTASDDAKNGRDALNFLTAKDCFIISFVFNTDGSAVAENSVNYLEIGVNSEGTGLDIPCPDQKDTDNSVYTIDGNQLSIVDAQGMTITTTVSIEGDTMTVDASDLDIPNFNAAGAKLVFKKR